MKKIALLFSLCCLAVSAAQAAVQGREVSYSADGTTLKGHTSLTTIPSRANVRQSWWCTSGGD